MEEERERDKGLKWEAEGPADWSIRLNGGVGVVSEALRERSEGKGVYRG